MVALDEKLNSDDDNVEDIDDVIDTSGRRPDDDNDAQGSAAKITTTILTHKDANIRQLINDVETAYGDIPSGDGGSGSVSSRWVDFLNWMSHPALGLQVMKENYMVIKMGDLSKRGAGQLYVDGRLIPGENIIDFISNMNNTRMMTIPHQWHYKRDLTQFIDYLNSLDVDNNMSDVMSYPYFKYLISRYNEYSSLYGTGKQISLKHTMRQDPYEILRRTQKLEWTKFLQTVFIGTFYEF